MEVTVDKIAIFLGCNSTFTVNAGTAWMSDDLANHVLSRVILET
jgi:hypothetical protein